jgi:hypothetical protein
VKHAELIEDMVTDAIEYYWPGWSDAHADVAAAAEAIGNIDLAEDEDERDWRMSAFWGLRSAVERALWSERIGCAAPCPACGYVT